jgi:NADH-quinone oxidoreductase subunit N
VSAKAAAHTHAAHAAHAAGTIVLPHIRYLAILPELIMLGGAIALLGVSALVRRTLAPRVVTGTTVVVSLTAFGFAWWQWVDVADHGPYTAVAHAVVVDGFSSLVVILVSAAMALSALVADAWVRREGSAGPEMHVLAMVSASGAMIMAAANDLVVVFLGLEILSIALYVLAALNHRRAASGEAALKYFLLGGFSSAIFVYGIALTYGATGTTNLAQIADFLSRSVILHDGVLLAGLSLLLVGFAFKVAAVPFHMWTPDVYQGAPSPITGFMAAVAKVGGFAALLRVFVSSFGVLRADWQPVVYAIAVLTLLVGAGLAVVQRDIKRMLAYSSINHAGFILLGLQAANAAGVSAALYYLFTYTFMVIGTFAVITVLGRHGDADHDIAGYRGLAARQPFLAFAFAVLLLAQAGVPFTTGFLAKLQVVAASVDVHSTPLAVIAMASAALAAFFYLRVAVLMYTPVRPAALPAGEEAPAVSLGAFGSAVPGPLDPAADGPAGAVASITRRNAGLLLDDAPIETVADDLVGEPDDERSVVKVPLGIAVAIGVCLAVTVVFGIIPAPLVDFAHKATLLFLP